MTRVLTIAFAVLGFGGLLPGEGPAEQLARTTSTQRIDFAPGGTIRLEKSWGDLYIEGWDQPQVEISVTKSTSYSDNPVSLKEKAAPKLDTIKVAADRRSDAELAISTMWAMGSYPLLPLSKVTRNGETTMCLSAPPSTFIT
jgi:hypothetical protein